MLFTFTDQRNTGETTDQRVQIKAGDVGTMGLVHLAAADRWLALTRLSSALPVADQVGIWILGGRGLSNRTSILGHPDPTATVDQV